MSANDTTAAARAVLLARMRALTPAESVARALDLSVVLRRAALNMVERDNPGWSPAECRVHLCRLWYGTA
ncbi:MAG: hypothetical protein V4813_15880 [Gemmatimonadota bacterium]